ncbi:DoxX family protein [Amnimonas aquatica]|uniref:AraC family transcriptional regulator n=1 Tax=Amnimonas aquatica TaxID=2094561 RepID=A0A2P6ARK3_9GAMM|nr:DoxX family protein [Amnimonas aquatica]PQA38040.1 AraC family transcriptional regulator [Amnimonas aquatica]
MIALLRRADALLISLTRPLRHLDGLPALALRFYLVPVFWMAGSQKLLHFSDTVAWFGDPFQGLGLPLPWLLAALATASELGGAVLLALGLATRWISLPLLATMVVAALAVHLPNGWQAIADPSAPFANAQVLAAAERLMRIRDILQSHGDYDWLTASGPVVILNNGVEFAVTYAVMLMALVVLGGGRYTSADWWLARYLRR